MHSSKVGWAGQAFALATSSDSGGKKARIRRSKEERKSMIESFVQKYQRSNDGNFPSLNLTHKEVGGSFYTVREIVREIIQENRVLAPPKVPLEEHNLSGFLEQHPLGSISMEPPIDLSVSDRDDVVTHIVPEKTQYSTTENISTSHVSYPLELNDQDGCSDGTSESHITEEVSNSPQSESHKFEENIVNGFEVESGGTHPDKPHLASADHSDDIEHQTVDKAKEFEQRICAESTAMDTLDRAKLEAENVEKSPAIKSHTASDIVVETFPLRPVPRTITYISEEYGELQEAAETLDDKGVELGKKLPHSTVELNGEKSDKKEVLNLQAPTMEDGKHPSASQSSILDAIDIPKLETKVSLLQTKASGSTEKSGDRENSSVAKENNSTVDRINLETWDGTAKNSTQHESNPVLAFVKAIISSFVKFWTE